MANAAEFEETSHPDLNEYMGMFDSDEDSADNPLQLLNLESKYYEIEDIPLSFSRDINYGYKSIHINIKSLPDKFDKLKLFLDRLLEVGLHIDFILLCETFLTPRNADMYQLPGYKFIHKSRSSKSCGGVAMYIRDNIIFKKR